MKLITSLLLTSLVVCSSLLSGCSKNPENQIERYSQKKGMMGTFVQVDVCLDPGQDMKAVEKAYSDIWSRLTDISWRMNVYDPKSDVSKVNAAFPDPVEVGPDTYDMFRRSVVYARQTDGAFMISIWPLIKLWRNSQKSAQVPEEGVLKKTLQQIGLDQLALLPGYQVARRNDVISLDLGGIAKGYAVDEVARIFREYQFQNFYIDAGGDIYVGGVNCRGEKWRIGIKDPRDPQKIVEKVVVSNQAVTTSGNYEQFMEINGERYSHIIDPSTGYPQREVVSATVIATTAEEADVYSTALTVLGRERGTALIDKEHPDKASLILVKQPDGLVVRKESRQFRNFKQP